MMSDPSQVAPRPGWTALRERMAFLEFDDGMSRDEAEKRVAREYLDRCQAEKREAPGITGELDTAASRRFEPVFQDVERRLNLTRVRAPMWGWSYVEPDGEGYHPAADGAEDHPAIVVPYFDNYGLSDLVAHGLRSASHRSRLGVADVLGLDMVEHSRESDRPLLVFRDVYMWLRANTLGAVVIDWETASYRLSGVRTILCHRETAQQLYDVTRNCYPRPTIAVHAPKEMRHAA